MKHRLVVYNPNTGTKVVEISLTHAEAAAIMALMEPDEDDPDLAHCYELPLGFFLEPDTD